MNVFHFSRWFTLTALLAIGTTAWSQQVAQQQPAAGQNGVEVLTRGPVHEAFAETITFDPEPGIVVPKAPPDPIEEMAPDQRPEGANVTWIPGYWGWDDERNDFLWVSGIWRALPPGRQWVPGYWGTVAARFSMDVRILGRCGGQRDRLPARAAGVGRGRSQHCRAFRRRHLVARLLDLAAEPLRMAPRLLGRQGIKTGIGCQTITCGRPAATSLSTATTTTRFRVAASCLRPSISIRVSAPSAVSPTHRRR